MYERTKLQNRVSGVLEFVQQETVLQGLRIGRKLLEEPRSFPALVICERDMAKIESPFHIDRVTQTKNYTELEMNQVTTEEAVPVDGTGEQER